MDALEKQYQAYRSAIKDRSLPLAYLDMDCLDQNCADVIARAKGKPIRIASKSIRSVEVLSHLFKNFPELKGIMVYSPREARHLLAKGFQDLLLAYPSLDARTLGAIIEEDIGGAMTFMVDDDAHLRMLDQLARAAGRTVKVCIDLDMSSVSLLLHFGVHRSPLRTVAQAVRLAERVRAYKHVMLSGVMGYEAQIAGLADQTPRRPVYNFLVQRLKKFSAASIAPKRQALVTALEARGFALDFVNGGGTGSLETTREDPAVTEVTVGSGLYSPHLFDDYKNFRHRPAAGFVLSVCRKPRAGIYTCHGGGYSASGAAGKDRLPKPYLPPNLELSKLEGAGEVQTPVLGSTSLRLSDPVFFRHAKAGELCEHFNELHLIRGSRVIDVVKTYRGDGECF